MLLLNAQHGLLSHVANPTDHDDVEIFVCQTQGKKRWRLYAPLAGFQLPSQSSGDLPESIIGPPIMDVTLEEGDVLYMPRGTIHQAAAQKQDSTHLTMSTYQRWSWGDLALNVLQQALTVSSTSAPISYPLCDMYSGSSLSFSFVLATTSPVKTLIFHW